MVVNFNVANVNSCHPFNSNSKAHKTTETDTQTDIQTNRQTDRTMNTDRQKTHRGHTCYR